MKLLQITGLVIICLFTFSLDLIAQANKKKIISNEWNQKEEYKNSEVKNKHDSLKEQLAQSDITDIDMNSTIVLPLIFHVINSQDLPIVSTEMIYKQIAALNRDFGSNNVFDLELIEKANFQDVVQNMNVQFCLADVENNSLNAIRYYNTDRLFWDDRQDFMDKSKGGVDPINSEKYINIYIVNYDTNIKGIAQSPDGDKNTDAISIDRSFILNIDNPNETYNQGKTLSHLMGNFLGLQSIWGNCPCCDDGISDTPITNALNNKCYEPRHISTCDGIVVEMTMNIMDNTPDQCRGIFTIEQCKLMRYVISDDGPRNKLKNSKVLCDATIDPREKAKASQRISFDLFPNPANRSTTIDNIPVEFNNGILQVRDANNRIITLIRIDSNTIELDCSTWASGVYFIHLKNDSGKTQVKKLIVE